MSDEQLKGRLTSASGTSQDSAPPLPSQPAAPPARDILVREEDGGWAVADGFIFLVDGLARSPNYAGREVRKAFRPAGWLILAVGAVLFLLAHAHEMPDRPHEVMARCAGLGLAFGIFAFCSRGWRPGATVVPLLVLLAGLLDAGATLQKRHALRSPSQEVAPAAGGRQP